MKLLMDLYLFFYTWMMLNMFRGKEEKRSHFVTILNPRYGKEWLSPG